MNFIYSTNKRELQTYVLVVVKRSDRITNIKVFKIYSNVIFNIRRFFFQANKVSIKVTKLVSTAQTPHFR